MLIKTIFNKSRYESLKKNNFGTYLKYAFGEIFLIVIGILIALWINNVNTSFQKSKKEKILLTEIKDNLVSDTISINKLYNFHSKKKKEINEFLNIISQNKPSDKNRYKAFKFFTQGNIFQTRNFKSKNVGYQNLISSGNIELIKNRNLRNIIVSYYLSTSDQLFALGAENTTTSKFKQYIVPRTINNWSLKQMTGLNFKLDNEEYIVGLNKDKQALSYLILLSNQIDFTDTRLDDLNSEIKDIIFSIEKELKIK